MIRNAYSALAVLTVCLIGTQALAETGRAFVQELITLSTDDAVSVPAILAYPKDGINIHSPAIVYLHGLGGSPVQALGAPRFVSEPLAAHGYTGLGILSRHSGEDRDIAFEKAVLDTKAAVDWLAQLGITDIILLGHSLGSVRSSSYWNVTRDTRIKAMIHFAPTRDLSNWARAGFGDERYEEVVSRLHKMVEDGRGDEYVFDTFEIPPPAPAGIERGFPHTAATWLSWMGPSAQTGNTELFANLNMPQLLLAGDADIFVTKDFMQSLKEAAAESPRVDTIWYEGGVDHIFTSARERARKGAGEWHEQVDLSLDTDSAAEETGDKKDQTAAGELTIRQQAARDTIAWLDDVGLGVRPRIETVVVDSQASDGLEQSGVLYQPESGRDPSKVGFLILHGYAGNAMSGSGEGLSVQLAQAGHLVLSPRSRAAGASSFNSLFHDLTKDTSGWIEYLTSNGAERVVLIGEGWGGIAASYYVAESADRRVAGIAYLNPATGGPDWASNALGNEQYQQLVKKAEAFVVAGNGKREMIYGRGELPPPAQPGTARLWHQTAESFLSEWGPDAVTDHADILRELNIAVLILATAGNNHLDSAGLKKLSKTTKGEAQYKWLNNNVDVTENILHWIEQTLDASDADQ